MITEEEFFEFFETAEMWVHDTAKKLGMAPGCRFIQLNWDSDGCRVEERVTDGYGDSTVLFECCLYTSHFESQETVEKRLSTLWHKHVNAQEERKRQKKESEEAAERRRYEILKEKYEGSE